MLLNTRQTTHGPYAQTAKISQELKAAMHANGWDSLNHLQCEALELIATKIARILSGNPNTAEHWKDIAGYAELVVREL
jgi:hypothetical protein